ncbi:MAG: amino acid adenylation domain-containing protein [Methylococcales bacterium]
MDPALTPYIFEGALKQLLNHHDALRMRFNQEGGEWKQYLLKDETRAVFECIDLVKFTKEQQFKMLESEASAQQDRLYLSDGPLMRAVWFNLGEDQPSRVFIVIHHLVVDGVSWRILLEDLAIACRQLMSGEIPVLPAKTTSFKYWSEQIINQVSAGRLQLDKAYWLDTRWCQVPVLPVDDSSGGNTFALEDNVTIALTEADTLVLLQDVPYAYNTKTDDLLLAALTLTLCDWMCCDSVLIDLEGHGREDIADDLDISRTVGWFTTVYPALLSIANSSSLGDALKLVKEQLRVTPMKGMSFGLLRYLSLDVESTAKLATQPKAQIIFNYLGQLDTVMTADTLFVPTLDATGASCDPAAIRAYELEIIGSISDGRMQLSWRYSKERFRKTTIETLSDNYLQHFKALIAHCLLPDSGSYTSSDFPLIALEQSHIDAMALKPRQIEDVYPLSSLQNGLMFHSLYTSESSVYCIQIGCRILGELNIPAFKQAWQQLVVHHPILRTCFHFENQDKPLQIVHKYAQLPITEYDWCTSTAQEQAQRWQKLQADDRKYGFDFTQAPLMRLGLAQCSEKEHYFLWSYHHILLDGWSTPLLIKDLFAAYEMIRCKDTVLLSTARPYRDYIAWLQNQNMASAETYWRSALSGFTAPTPLLMGKAADRNTQHQTNEFGKQTLTLSTGHTQALLDFVKQQQLTVNTLVQGAWGLLLSRYSGENDIIFGATVSGRPADLTGVESMVGLFINTLPLRIKIMPDNTVLGWLKALLTQNQDMRRYEYTPLMQIQGWSEVSRGMALFESLLVFENYPINQALTEHVAGLTVDMMSVVDQNNYPLTLSAFPGTELRLEITYAADQFEAETIKQMLVHLQCLLEAFVEQPQRRLSETSLLSAEDKQQILVDWNATEVNYPTDRFIHQLFEAQVVKTPDVDAVVFVDQMLSYAELNAKANQLANYLCSKGVGPDVLVGICLERSLEMVIGLLGILKAGGAYVPLDPSYPQDRLDFMLHDVGTSIVLTQEACLKKLSASVAAVLCLDSEWHVVEKSSTENPDILLVPENLAYCIYTSGSTGQPKGAGVPHQGILNRLQWMQEQYSLDQMDRVLQKTPYSFDVSVWEFFWPLMTGAKLIVAKPEEHKESLALIDTITALRVTTIHFVPSMLQVFVDTPGVENCTSLTRVICSGEALPADLVARFHQKLPAELHNLYGPTEASVDVSYWTCLPGCVDTAIPIGRPIDNITLYILDRQLNPVLVGTPGELHIGGIGLGRGYLNRPELTAEKFIPNPYCPVGSRLYKTGDLVRYRPDGTIDYLGRNDFQIKIRGFRIELGEIENRLSLCVGVREAVVIAREDGHGNKRLVAYLTEDNSGELSIPGLRADLAMTLPDYMLPTAFVVLPVLPLTANGKLDRSALPKPDADSVISHRYEVPQGLIEITLSNIWQELLELERVGRNDHFFELGGHSLMALTLVERLRQEGWALEPRMVFANPILSVLAAAIADNQSNNPVFDMPPNLIPDHFGQSLSNPVIEEFQL